MSTPEASSPPHVPASPEGTVPVPDATAAIGETRERNGHSELSSEGAASVENAAELADSNASTANESENEAEGAPDESGPAEGEAGAEAEAKQGPEEKKRRRRRRKKKPGGQASATEGVSGEPGAEGETPADGAHEDDPTKAQRKPEKKRKAGPPRERPPVNLGDIVFGKIVEITDEAILIDIPGKARAIFDRRELLLPEDEDTAQASPAPAVEAAAPPAESESDGPPAEAAPETSSSADSPAGIEAVAESSGAASTTSESPVELAAEAVNEADPPDASSNVQVAEAPVPKDPKVPHVVLEAGTDFIGVVHGDGSRGGLVVLTHHPRRLEKSKIAAEKALADKTTVDGLVTGVIKGGVEVDLEGLRAFAPGSQVDVRMGADLSYLVARRLPFFVTQYAKRGRDVVLSRRSIIEEEARKARTEALANLKIGEDVDGIVRSVVSFGAFIDVGGVEGLVPLHEMSHNRSDGPSDVFKAGEPVRVRVVKVDDRGKVWLSRRATIPDPWQQVAAKYALGTRHVGKVVRLQHFGAFIELEPGIDGLIHTQDLSIKRIEVPDEVVKVGDPIDVVVAHLDPTQHKIGLHPAPQGDAANEPAQRVVVHKPVKAKVVTVESGGLVVRIMGVTGRNARGYVTAAATGTPRGTELRKAFNVGHELEAKVLELDPRRGEVKLSIRALSEELERSAYQQYRQQLKAEAKFTFGDLLAKKGNPSR